MALMLVIADDLTGAADCGVACACARCEAASAASERSMAREASGFARTEYMRNPRELRRLYRYRHGAARCPVWLPV